MANPKKLHRGQVLDSLPGDTFNALVDGEIRDRQTRRIETPGPPLTARSSVLARLRWTGEDPLPPGSVVVLGDALFDPTDDPSAPFEGLQFTVTAPEAADPDAQVAITLGPIAAGGIGYGHLAGAAWALVDVTDEAHEFAELQDGATLASASNGRFPILWKQEGTGAKKWAMVLLGGGGGGLRMIRGLTTAAVSGSDFTGDGIEVIAPAGGVAPDEPVDITNDFMMNGDNNAPFVAVWQPERDTWLCIQMKCPT